MAEADLNEGLIDNLATARKPIPTSGEVFPDGGMIDLVRSSLNHGLNLASWNGIHETIGPRVEHDHRLYQPAPINASVAESLPLPTKSAPHGTTREFLREIREVIWHFVDISEQFIALVARVVLCTAIVDALSVAPMLIVGGPDAAGVNQLVALLGCLCRHALILTGVTPAGLCSLPNGFRFSLLINQPLSAKMLRLLDNVSIHDQKIPSRGGLLDLFGVQIISSNLAHNTHSWPVRSIPISVLPTTRPLPRLDLGAQRLIIAQFQPKLLSFRRANLSLAREINFDASLFSPPSRDLARSLAASTPDDPDLQAELFDLLWEQDDEVRSEKWADPNVVSLQAIVVAGHESRGKFAYVAELAKIATEILQRREALSVEINPAVLGKTLKTLGFRAEQRDAKGKKLLLSQNVISRAKQLAHDLGGPTIEDDDQVEE